MLCSLSRLQQSLKEELITQECTTTPLDFNEPFSATCELHYESKESRQTGSAVAACLNHVQ